MHIYFWLALALTLVVMMCCIAIERLVLRTLVNQRDHFILWRRLV